MATWLILLLVSFAILVAAFAIEPLFYGSSPVTCGIPTMLIFLPIALSIIAVMWVVYGIVKLTQWLL